MLKMFLIHKQIQPQRKPHMIQRWVETGDPRCPLAGMWTTLASNTTESADEGDLPGRILHGLARGCAFPTSVAA